MWRVYNMNPEGHTHKETFKGDVITIKANEYVLMDYYEATEFRGQFYPMKFDGMGQQDPKTFKCIKLVPDSTPVSEDKVLERVVYVCNLDGKKFETQEMLDAHVKENYSDRFYKDEILEKEIEAKKGKK